MNVDHDEEDNAARALVKQRHQRTPRRPTRKLEFFELAATNNDRFTAAIEKFHIRKLN